MGGTTATASESSATTAASLPCLTTPAKKTNVLRKDTIHYTISISKRFTYLRKAGFKRLLPIGLKGE